MNELTTIRNYLPLNALGIVQLISGLLLLLVSAGIKPETLDIVYTHENPEFSELIEAFSHISQHKVTTTWVDQSDLRSRMVNLDIIRNVPDVIISPADSLGMSGSRLLKVIPEQWLSATYSDKVLETVTVGNEILGLPIVQGNHLILYYNKSHAPQGATHWSELVQLAETIPSDKALIRWSFMEMYWFVPFITAFGDLPVVNHQPNLNSASMKQALEFSWQMVEQGMVDSSCSYTCADKQFKNGQVVFLINGIWAYESYSQALGKDFGAMALPLINNKPMRPYFSTIVATFPKAEISAEKEQALKEFSQYIQSTSFQQRLWNDIREIPAVTDVLDAISKQADHDTKVLLDTLKNTVPMSSHENMTIIWEVILKGYLRYGSGIWNAERSSAYMQQLAKQHIAKLNTQN